MTFLPRAAGAFLFAALACAPAALAQSPCLFSTLPVPNGDLENPLFNPWLARSSSSAFVGTYRQMSVDGVTTSRCFEGNTSFSLYQQTPIPLQNGVTYEFGFDVLNSNTSGHYVEIWDAAGANRVHRSQFQSVASGRGRISTGFTPSTGGDYTIQITSDRAAVVDNIYVRANPIWVRVLGARSAGSTSTVQVRGEANANYALFLTWSGQLPSPVSIGPACAGGWGLNGRVLRLSLGSLDRLGRFDTALDIPIEFADLPVAYQAVALPPNCAFGCAGGYRYF